MAFERNLWGFDGELTFICDECGHEEHTGKQDFQAAIAHIKSFGWKVKRENNDWVHVCCANDDE